MTGRGLLHNMSVPPRSTVTVRRSRLPGRRYAIDCKLTQQSVIALRKDGAAAALVLLAGQVDVPLAAPGQAQQNVQDIFDACMAAALRDASVPDCIGVFTDEESDASASHELTLPAMLALLARKSGPLYLPRRRFTPSLIVPTTAVLVFPQ